MVEPDNAYEASGDAGGIGYQSVQPEVSWEHIGDAARLHIAPSGGADAELPVYVDTVGIASQEEPVRVTLYERGGNQVLVRQVDPCDVEPPPVALFDGDEVRVMEAISHTSLHTGSEVGNVTGFLFQMRVVPVRVEGTTVFARTLQHDEVDDGRRVHVVPGGQVTFEEGAIVAELEHIDSQSEPTTSGHRPLTPVLWTWLTIGTGHDETRTRFLLAAARRLDTANLLLIEVEELRDRLNREDLAGPAIRRNLFELIGFVEQMVISLGRAVDMVFKANTHIERVVPIPQAVVDASPSVKDIRDAYEHIDERAAGNVKMKPHPDALTIFDWRRLIVDNTVAYGDRQLELVEQVPALIASIRQFLKDVAADG